MIASLWSSLWLIFMISLLEILIIAVHMICVCCTYFIHKFYNLKYIFAHQFIFLINNNFLIFVSWFYLFQSIHLLMYCDFFLLFLIIMSLIYMLTLDMLLYCFLDSFFKLWCSWSLLLKFVVVVVLHISLL